MELSELRSFMTLCETLHFGRAATRLHITQPALTKQIKRLEVELGGELLVELGWIGGHDPELAVFCEDEELVFYP